MKRYDKQFKEEAVRLVLEQGRPVVAVAKEIGVHESTLYTWVGQFRAVVPFLPVQSCR